jgi:hypothetical protein
MNSSGATANVASEWMHVWNWILAPHCKSLFSTPANGANFPEIFKLGGFKLKGVWR